MSSKASRSVDVFEAPGSGSWPACSAFRGWGPGRGSRMGGIPPSSPTLHGQVFLGRRQSARQWALRVRERDWDTHTDFSVLPPSRNIPERPRARSYAVLRRQVLLAEITLATGVYAAMSSGGGGLTPGALTGGTLRGMLLGPGCWSYIYLCMECVGLTCSYICICVYNYTYGYNYI